MWFTMMSRALLLLLSIHSTLQQQSNLRLADGDPTNVCSGRVELRLHSQGAWGTVCDNYWDINDAEVVCRQLGCGRAKAAPRMASFGKGSGPIWLYQVGCTGTESSLNECYHRHQVNSNECNHSDDAGVICDDNTEADAPPMAVRLVGSRNPCTGLLEVFIHNQWGTVCDEDWGKEDAQVVCKELHRTMGCGTKTFINTAHVFPYGGHIIWASKLGCNGTEKALEECSMELLPDCPHHRDVEVYCFE